MSEEKKEKIIYIVTHGPEDPERCSLPFVLANAALAMDVEAVVVFQANAVLLARQDCANHVFAGGLPPLKDLMKDFFDLGGKLYVCTPCIKERQISEDTLIKEAELVAAGVLTNEILSADATLVY